MALIIKFKIKRTSIIDKRQPNHLLIAMLKILCFLLISFCLYSCIDHDKVEINSKIRYLSDRKYSFTDTICFTDANLDSSFVNFIGQRNNHSVVDKVEIPAFYYRGHSAELPLNIWDSKIKGESQIITSYLFGGFVISNSMLGSRVTFFDTHVYASSGIHDSVLPDVLDLERFTLEEDATLDISSNYRPIIRDRCALFINKDLIGKVKIPSSLYKIYFYPNKPFEYKTAFFEALIEHCKKLGMVTSVRDFDIQYKEAINSHNWNFSSVNVFNKQIIFLPLGEIANFINKHWWNFGYNKPKVLWFWLPFFFLLFSGINYFIIQSLVGSVYRDGEIGKSFGFKHDVEDIMKNRLAYSLFYTGAIYFNVKLKYDGINFANLKGVAYLYLIYITGLIHVTLGVLGYIFK